MSMSWEAAIVGPTQKIYEELMASLIRARFQRAWTATDATGEGLPLGPFFGSVIIDGVTRKNKPWDLAVTNEKDIENRASIVTLFRR